MLFNCSAVYTHLLSLKPIKQQVLLFPKAAKRHHCKTLYTLQLLSDTVSALPHQSHTLNQGNTGNHSRQSTVCHSKISATCHSRQSIIDDYK